MSRCQRSLRKRVFKHSQVSAHGAPIKSGRSRLHSPCAIALMLRRGKRDESRGPAGTDFQERRGPLAIPGDARQDERLSADSQAKTAWQVQAGFLSVTLRFCLQASFDGRGHSFQFVEGLRSALVVEQRFQFLEQGIQLESQLARADARRACRSWFNRSPIRSIVRSAGG